MSEIMRFGGLELRFLQDKAGTHGGLDLFEMIVQPKANMPVPHYHETWDETIVGLTGTTTWTVDGAAMAVGAGISVFIRRGIVHGFANDTDEPASCLCVLTPGVLGPGYFREMEALVAAGHPDPASLNETMLRHGLVPVEPTPPS